MARRGWRIKKITHVVARAFFVFARNNLLISWGLLRREEQEPSSQRHHYEFFGEVMKRIIILFFITSILISSCNIPSATSPESAEAIQTFAALTVEAAINNGGVPLASPTAAQAGSGNGTVQATSASNSTGDPSASFEDVTNCRTGPGVNYERITQILPNESVEVIGFYPPNYWIVNSKEGACWVAGEFVTPSGSLAAVPTVTAPPTPQGEAPPDVSLQQWNVSCNYATNDADIYIRWTDKDTESGYRVFRNNEQVAELLANSTEFTETITLLSGQSVGYYVVAFNEVGSTSSKSITLSC